MKEQEKTLTEMPINPELVTERANQILRLVETRNQKRLTSELNQADENRVISIFRVLIAKALEDKSFEAVAEQVQASLEANQDPIVELLNLYTSVKVKAEDSLELTGKEICDNLALLSLTSPVSTADKALRSSLSQLSKTALASLA